MTFIKQHLEEIVGTLFVIKTQGLPFKFYIYVSRFLTILCVLA